MLHKDDIHNSIDHIAKHMRNILFRFNFNAHTVDLK